MNKQNKKPDNRKNERLRKERTIPVDWVLFATAEAFKPL